MARPADPNARSALVAAARQAFVRHGVQGARIEDITRACGLSKGAFYLHFASKEALFRELVDALIAEMDALLERRERESAAVLLEGGLRRGGVRGREALGALEALDVRSDRAALEALWEHRDVMDVLLRGSQGTEFDGVVWHLIDREMGRVVAGFEAFKRLGVYPRSLPSQVAAAMLVGTWVVMARQMALSPRKPDLDGWVVAMRRLLTEGAAPRLPPSGARRAARRARPARETKAKRSGRR